MSRKLEQLRRNGETVKSASPEHVPAASNNKASRPSSCATDKTIKTNKLDRPMSFVDDTKSHSTKAFKTFFHRIGSTGMLNHRSSQSSTSSSSSKSSGGLPSPSQLYRSSSTSQLNSSSSSYIKCADPTEGVNLSNKSSSIGGHYKASPPHKSSSYDDITVVTDSIRINSGGGGSSNKGFPYAFLRSKLSVLPEENGGSVLNHKRMQPNHLGANNFADPLTPHLRRFHYVMAPSSSRDNSLVNGENGGGGGKNQRIMQHQHSSDESSSSNSPRASTNIEWEPMTGTYQRLSSCLSSNESGYDSDGRHADDSSVNVTISTISTPGDCGSPVTIVSSPPTDRSIAPSLECNGTIRRRFRQIRLSKALPNDVIGLVLSPQYCNINEVDVEIRYLVSDIDVNGLAYW